jgi:hypothetical protein
MYPSDLTDKQWELVKGRLKRPGPRGARETHAPCVIVNVILYVLRPDASGGCSSTTSRCGRRSMTATAGGACAAAGRRRWPGFWNAPLGGRLCPRSS